jgi:hypothetical protein
MRASHVPGAGQVEILPLVIVTQAFPARPSSLPEVRDFVRRRLTQTPLADDDVRTLCERVADVLLDAAGASRTIQVSLRIFPAHAEVDVLLSQPDDDPAGPADWATTNVTGPGAHSENDAANVPIEVGSPGVRPTSVSFADWLYGALRRDGMTMEAAARRLKVSAKTVSRWVGGTTEPRLRDLSRIRDVFGDPPFP